MAQEGATFAIEFDVNSPAEELFQAFMEAIKEKNNVKTVLRWEHKTDTTIHVHNSLLFRKFETFKVIIDITPMEDDDDHGISTHVKCTLEFKKNSPVINGPDLSINASTRRSVEFDLKKPEDDMFEAFIDALVENNVDVAVEAEDPVNRTTTFSLSSYYISKKHKTLKVTTTVTPKEDGSHVTWTVEFEKYDEDDS